MNGLIRTVTLDLGFVFGLLQPDVVLGLVASSIVKKRLYGVRNHNSCIAPQVLAVADLPPLEVQLVSAVLGHIVVPVSSRLKSQATPLMPKGKF